MDPRRSHPGSSQPGTSWAGDDRHPGSQGRPPRQYGYSRPRFNPVLDAEVRARGEPAFTAAQYSSEYTTLRPPETEAQRAMREIHLDDYLQRVDEKRRSLEEVARAEAKTTAASRPWKPPPPPKQPKAIKFTLKSVKRELKEEVVWPGDLPKAPPDPPVESPPVTIMRAIKKEKEPSPDENALVQEQGSDLPEEVKPCPPPASVEAKEFREALKEIKQEPMDRRKPEPDMKHAKQPDFYSDGGYFQKLYKLVRDPAIQGGHKHEIVKRYNGKCAGTTFKNLEYPGPPSDPRSKYRRLEQPKSLPLFSFTVDDNYKGVPPKREVTISQLNDNVNKDFLEKMAKSQKFDPKEVLVFHHPTTKKHLHIALILFRTSSEARAFVEANDGHSVMGTPIHCCLDPFAAQLSSMYGEATEGALLPPLRYLEAMTPHELSLRREALIGRMVPEPAAEKSGAPAMAAVAQDEGTPRNRSLSPMDTSNSPPLYDSLPRAAAAEGSYGDHQHRQHNPDAVSTSRMPSPPPPYSELPPQQQQHRQRRYEDERRRSASRKRSQEPEGMHGRRREKRRRASTSSSSAYSSNGEGGRRASSRRRRREEAAGCGAAVGSASSAVEKKRQEYLKVKRYVSSERDSNGDKRILKEVKTVTYKSRTEQRTTIGHDSPDSFDEEMSRRERETGSRGKQQRRSASRGGDEMRWSTPSSDSDGGRRRKKRAKEAAESSVRESDRSTTRPAPPSADATPSQSAPHSTTSTPSRPRRGFHDGPPAAGAAAAAAAAAVTFDPTQPPPGIVIIPPVGLVVPDCASLPLPPPFPPAMGAPKMVPPPPPLPGGFIPPPEFFGLMSTPAMLCAVSAAAAGLTPLPPMPPPPPSMMMMMGYGGGGATPGPAYSSPVKNIKSAKSHLDEAAGSASPSANSTPVLSSSTTATASAAGEGKAPPTAAALAATAAREARGGSTPGEKKVNLDERLSQLFGIKKAKREDEEEKKKGIGTTATMKHVASAPAISGLAASGGGAGRERQEDDMEVEEEDDDDNMDVASSSSEGGATSAPAPPPPPTTMGVAAAAAAAAAALMRERAEADRREHEERRKIREADQLTKKVLDKLTEDLRLQIQRDIMKKIEWGAMDAAAKWEQRQASDMEERKRQEVRAAMKNAAASAAADGGGSAASLSGVDPMEAMLAAKLRSPEGLNSVGISKVFSSINIIKRKNLHVANFSRDGTPASRDSRAQSRTKSRSLSSSRSGSRSSGDAEKRRRRRRDSKKQRHASTTSSSTASSSASSYEEEEEEEGSERRRLQRKQKQRGRRASTSSQEEEEEEERPQQTTVVKRRPNVRNIESSQESSAASTSVSSSSSSEDEDEETAGRKRKSKVSSASSSCPLDDDEVDVVGMSEDEAALHARRAQDEGATAASASAAANAAATARLKEVKAAAAPNAAAAAAPAPSSGAAATLVRRQLQPQLQPVQSAAAQAAARRWALQQELQQQLPSSMRPDPATGGYHPIRHDHPYVRGLGIPMVSSRGVNSSAIAARRLADDRIAAQAAAAETTAAAAANAMAERNRIATEAAEAAAAAGGAYPRPPQQQLLQLTKTKKELLNEERAKAGVAAALTSVPVRKPLAPLLPTKNESATMQQRPEEKKVVVPRPRKQYKQRSAAEQTRVLESFKAGLDEEDEKFLQLALAQLQVDGRRPFGAAAPIAAPAAAREVQYEARVRAFTPRELVVPTKHGRLDLYYDDDDLAGIVPHATGCARAEGFYRLTFKQKIRIMRRPEAYQDRTEINERDEVVTRHQVQAQKEQRSMNRRLQTMVDSNPNSEFFKVNQLKYRKKMIKFARSRIHGWGLYALEPIAPDDMIVEYIGQKIRPIVADEREKAYERRGIGSSYLFRIDEDEVIDATKQGNFARFINHSCQPNCYAKVVTVDGDKRIVIYSKSLIQKGDEITYDYKFPLEEEKIECLCGAPQCRGTLN